MRGKDGLPQNREQDLGGLKGLSLEGTPTRRGSLEAFCRQKFLSSAAAWDTCRARHMMVACVERRNINSLSHVATVFVMLQLARCQTLTLPILSLTYTVKAATSFA